MCRFASAWFSFCLCWFCSQIVSEKSLQESGDAAAAAARSASSSDGPPASGGKTKRLEYIEKSGDGANQITGKLRASLKRDWASGEISAKKVQEYSYGAEHDDASFVGDLSKLSTFGKESNHMHRDSLRLFGNPKGAPPMDWINIPGKDGSTLCQPFLMPHKFFLVCSMSAPTFLFTFARP